MTLKELKQIGTIDYPEAGKEGVYCWLK